MVGVPPDPASIALIESWSAANAPTISHSGLCFANPSGLAGYLESIFLAGVPDDVLYALESFA